MNMKHTEVESITSEVAQFIKHAKLSDISEPAKTAAKNSLLDGLGLALAGSVAESGHLVVEYLRQQEMTGKCAVLGTSIKTTARGAAFANGVAIHADDYDDTQLAAAANRVYGLLTHPTAPVLPAALAFGQTRSSSGEDFFLAYQIGVEVASKIAEAIDPRHYQTGFHTTGTCGTFGAAAAAAKLAGLDVGQITRALSLAGSQAAGLRENFGTMTKPFHAGRAAENGVFAAELASMGWTAAPTILEAPRGFFRAAGGGWSEEAIRGKLGSPWTFEWPGVSIKPHPSGSLTHPAMGVMLDLIRQHGIKADEVTKIRVGTNNHMPTTLLHNRPATELQAKFSMQFSMAILLLEGRAGLSEYTDVIVQRPDVKAMIERVDFHVHPEADANGFDKMTSIVEVHMKNGTIFEGRGDFAKGSPSMPLSYEQVAEKFLECAEHAKWSDSKARQVIAQVENIEGLESVGSLIASLSN